MINNDLKVDAVQLAAANSASTTNSATLFSALSGTSTGHRSTRRGNGRFVPGFGTLQGSATRAGYRRWPLGSAWCLAGLYGKAGGGWVDNHATITNLNTGASISASNRNSGWVVGGGVEWALGGNWSAKLEYDFLKLDDLTFGPGPFRGDTFTASARFRCSKLV